MFDLQELMEAVGEDGILHRNSRVLVVHWYDLHLPILYRDFVLFVLLVLVLGPHCQIDPLRKVSFDVAMQMLSD